MAIVPVTERDEVFPIYTIRKETKVSTTNLGDCSLIQLFHSEWIVERKEKQDREMDAPKEFPLANSR